MFKAIDLCPNWRLICDDGLLTSDWIAGVAVVIALLSFVVNLSASQAADRRSRMPVLVMQRLDDVAGMHQIKLRNVGTGPAINLIFGLGEESAHGGSEKQLDKGIHESWFNPIHLRPLAAGEDVVVAHPVSANLLGVSYTDALGKKYTLKTSQYGTIILEGAHLPEGWVMTNVPMIGTVLPPGVWRRTDAQGRLVGP